MRHFLWPCREYDSAYSIPYDDLYEEGFRGLIFDIDNTLVKHDAPADENAVGLFERLRSIGFRTCLISNNNGQRVTEFARAVGSAYTADAGKPRPGSYLSSCRTMGIDRNQAVFIGDQLFTDVLGANLAGIESILVRPIGKDPGFFLNLKRILEKPVLFLYHLTGRKTADGKHI